jgi:hypothetical protein
MSKPPDDFNWFAALMFACLLISALVAGVAAVVGIWPHIDWGR